MIGPKITLKASCFDCDYCRTESYNVQGDHGTDVYCDKLSKWIGDTKWRTPKWCPFYPKNIEEMINSAT